jgi:hypothetical protein
MNLGGSTVGLKQLPYWEVWCAERQDVSGWGMELYALSLASLVPTLPAHGAETDSAGTVQQRWRSGEKRGDR